MASASQVRVSPCPTLLLTHPHVLFPQHSPGYHWYVPHCLGLFEDANQRQRIILKILGPEAVDLKQLRKLFLQKGAFKESSTLTLATSQQPNEWTLEFLYDLWFSQREINWKGEKKGTYGGKEPSCCCSVTQSYRTLWPHGPQHTRLPCPSPSPGACSNSCPLSQWCHPTILSSVVPFSSCLQSFPASGSFLMSQVFASGGQSTGVSASASVFPMNTQDWFPLELTGLISFRGLSSSDHELLIARRQGGRSKEEKCELNKQSLFCSFTLLRILFK